MDIDEVKRIVCEHVQKQKSKQLLLICLQQAYCFVQNNCEEDIYDFERKEVEDNSND